ncbi:MAG: general secretion pathway protein GspL, partial [Burkholderiales bacterium]|nr:general secretion pathway protein GspL [Burkholderiales bacterium]
AAAGKPGPGDLEALLAAAAGAWPDGSAPVVTLRFEPGKLTLTAPGWADAQVAQFRERLRGLGYGAESANGALVVTPSGAAA